MSNFEFPSKQICPLCQAEIQSAELKPQYDPVVVFACPRCAGLLWKPGLDDTGPVFAFDPNASDDSI